MFHVLSIVKVKIKISVVYTLKGNIMQVIRIKSILSFMIFCISFMIAELILLDMIHNGNDSHLFGEHQAIILGFCGTQVVGTMYRFFKNNKFVIRWS